MVGNDGNGPDQGKPKSTIVWRGQQPAAGTSAPQEEARGARGASTVEEGEVVVPPKRRENGHGSGRAQSPAAGRRAPASRPAPNRGVSPPLLSDGGDSRGTSRAVSSVPASEFENEGTAAEPGEALPPGDAALATTAATAGPPAAAAAAPPTARKPRAVIGLAAAVLKEAAASINGPPKVRPGPASQVVAVGPSAADGRHPPPPPPSATVGSAGPTEAPAKDSEREKKAEPSAAQPGPASQREPSAEPPPPAPAAPAEAPIPGNPPRPNRQGAAAAARPTGLAPYNDNDHLDTSDSESSGLPSEREDGEVEEGEVGPAAALGPRRGGSDAPSAPPSGRGRGRSSLEPPPPPADPAGAGAAGFPASQHGQHSSRRHRSRSRHEGGKSRHRKRSREKRKRRSRSRSGSRARKRGPRASPSPPPSALGAGRVSATDAQALLLGFGAKDSQRSSPPPGPSARSKDRDREDRGRDKDRGRAGDRDRDRGASGQGGGRHRSRSGDRGGSRGDKRGGAAAAEPRGYDYGDRDRGGRDRDKARGWRDGREGKEGRDGGPRHRSRTRSRSRSRSRARDDDRSRAAGAGPSSAAARAGGKEPGSQGPLSGKPGRQPFPYRKSSPEKVPPPPPDESGPRGARAADRPPPQRAPSSAARPAKPEALPPLPLAPGAPAAAAAAAAPLPVESPSSALRSAPTSQMPQGRPSKSKPSDSEAISGLTKPAVRPPGPSAPSVPAPSQPPEPGSPPYPPIEPAAATGIAEAVGPALSGLDCSVSSIKTTTELVIEKLAQEAGAARVVARLLAEAMEAETKKPRHRIHLLYLVDSILKNGREHVALKDKPWAPEIILQFGHVLPRMVRAVKEAPEGEAKASKCIDLWRSRKLLSEDCCRRGKLALAAAPKARPDPEAGPESDTAPHAPGQPQGGVRTPLADSIRPRALSARTPGARGTGPNAEVQFAVLQRQSVGDCERSVVSMWGDPHSLGGTAIELSHAIRGAQSLLRKEADLPNGFPRTKLSDELSVLEDMVASREWEDVDYHLLSQAASLYDMASLEVYMDVKDTGLMEGGLPTRSILDADIELRRYRGLPDPPKVPPEPSPEAGGGPGGDREEGSPPAGERSPWHRPAADPMCAFLPAFASQSAAGPPPRALPLIRRPDGVLQRRDAHWQPQKREPLVFYNGFMFERTELDYHWRSYDAARYQVQSGDATDCQAPPPPLPYGAPPPPPEPEDLSPPPPGPEEGERYLPGGMGFGGGGPGMSLGGMGPGAGGAAASFFTPMLMNQMGAMPAVSNPMALSMIAMMMGAGGGMNHMNQGMGQQPFYPVQQMPGGMMGSAAGLIPGHGMMGRGPLGSSYPPGPGHSMGPRGPHGPPVMAPMPPPPHGHGPMPPVPPPGPPMVPGPPHHGHY